MDMMPPMQGPPMVDPMVGGTPNGDMTMDDPSMTNPGMENGSDFDTNFDAGVEAEENTDPKKYIQQLTGKLSQSLRKYNQSLPQPEVELCKYVAGMILKQTTDGLTDGDKKEIIDKVNGNDNCNKENEQPPMGSDDGMNDFDLSQGQQEPMSENTSHISLINEIFQELTQGRKENDIAERPIKNIGYRKKCVTSPTL